MTAEFNDSEPSENEIIDLEDQNTRQQELGDLPEEIQKIITDADIPAPTRDIPDLKIENFKEYDPTINEKPDRKDFVARGMLYEIDGPKEEMVSALPMIHIFSTQRSGYSQTVNSSAVDFYDPLLQKIFNWIEQVKEKELYGEFDDIEPEVDDDQIPRVLQSLSTLVEIINSNINDLIDPKLVRKRKDKRQLEEKTKKFREHGYKEMAVILEDHITVLIKQGHFKQSNFGNYKKYINDAVKGNGMDAIRALKKAVLYAEAVLPMHQNIQPMKRVREAIPAGVTG